MPFVLKTDGGEYLRSRDAWTTTLTNNIALARVYTRRSDASRSGNSQGRYNKTPVKLRPVEIEMKEKE